MWRKIWCACALELKHSLQKITHFSLHVVIMHTAQMHQHLIDFIHLIIVKKEYKSLKRRETKNTTLIASGKLMCINHSKRLHESSQWIMYIEHIAFILETYESISFLPDQKWTLNLATKAIFRSKVLSLHFSTQLRLNLI